MTTTEFAYTIENLEFNPTQENAVDIMLIVEI